MKFAEVTIRQLREKVREFEENMEQQVQTVVKEKEGQLQRYYNDREQQLQEAGGVLSVKVQEMERQVSFYFILNIVHRYLLKSN